MPIYEYRCSDCGHRLEALQRLADKPLLACPACGKESLIKLISAVGFQLKGSGWYATDFKHSGSKPPEKSAAKGDASAGGGDAANAGAKGEGSAATASSGDQKSDAKSSAASAASSPSASESKTTSADSKSSPAATPAKPAATGS